jgi:hypothetical protein
MSTYSSNLKIEEIGTGEQAGTWGTTTNDNFVNVFEEAIVGRVTVSFSDADVTLTATNTVASQSFRNVYLNCTGTNAASRNLIVPTINKNYVVENNTTGGFNIVVKTSAGTGITIPSGQKCAVYVDGTNVVVAFSYFASSTTFASITDEGNLTFTGTANRIRGDFSNATHSNRVLFQSSTTNGNTKIGTIPNGTSVTSGFVAYGLSDPNNCAFLDITTTVDTLTIRSSINGTGSYFPLTFFNGGVEAMRISTAQDVGIGTTSTGSGYRLSVAGGSVRVNQSAYVAYEANSGSVQVQFASNGTSNIGVINVVTSHPLTFSTNNTERMRLDTSNGMILSGVGSITRLFGNGNGYLTGIYDAGNAFDYWSLAGNFVRTSSTTGTITNSLLGTAEVAITTGGSNQGSIRFSTGLINTVPTERMTILSSGRVGIGTTSPAEILDVNGNVNMGLTLSTGYGGTSGSPVAMELGLGRGNNAGSTLIDFHSGPTLIDYDTRIIRNTGTNGDFEISNYGTGNILLTQLNAGAILFTTSSAERMRISAAGFIGIGTPSPTNLLTLNNSGSGATSIFTGLTTSSITAELSLVRTGTGSTLVGQGAAFQFVNATSNDSVIVQQGTNAAIQFFNNPAGAGWAERMRIAGNGQITINSAPASGIFTVRQAANQVASFAAGNSYGGSDGIALISVNDANSAYLQLALAGSAIILNNAGGSGYVGIKTNTPQGYLDVGVGSTSAPTNPGAIRVLGGAANGSPATGGIEFLTSTSGTGYGWKFSSPDAGAGDTRFIMSVRNSSATWSDVMYMSPQGNLSVGGALNQAKVFSYTDSSTTYPLIAQNGAVTDTLGQFTTLAYFSNSRGVVNDGIQIIQYQAATYTSGDTWPFRTFRMQRAVDGGGAQCGIEFTTNSIRIFINDFSVANLAGAGNRAVYSDATGVLTNSSSDATLKTNVEDISYGLDATEKLRGVSYNWIDTEKRGAQREIGLIAQEVQQVIPEVIGTNDNGTLSVDYPKLTAVLIKAVQELNAKVTALETQLKGN